MRTLQIRYDRETDQWQAVCDGVVVGFDSLPELLEWSGFTEEERERALNFVRGLLDNIGRQLEDEE